MFAAVWIEGCGGRGQVSDWFARNIPHTLVIPDGNLRKQGADPGPINAKAADTGRIGPGSPPRFFGAYAGDDKTGIEFLPKYGSLLP
ncbi:hypothetical protein MACH15_23240 [Maricaulis maris]|nr:hypothetical protein MACH15_23240 [Maricaulis maris]